MALDLNQLELYFQPQYDLSSMRLTGFEALLRWRHPVHGMVSPAEFIPLAEEHGLIAGIGAWVLREGCTLASRWRSDVKVAINLSPLQFEFGNVVEIVKAALSDSGLSATRLDIEVTESVLMKNSNLMWRASSSER